MYLSNEWCHHNSVGGWKVKAGTEHIQYTQDTNTDTQPHPFFSLCSPFAQNIHITTQPNHTQLQVFTTEADKFYAIPPNCITKQCRERVGYVSAATLRQFVCFPLPSPFSLLPSSFFPLLFPLSSPFSLFPLSLLSPGQNRNV